MRMHVLAAATGLVALATPAHAAVTTSLVQSSVNFTGTGANQAFSAMINRNSGIGDIGTFMGQFGTNAAIRGKFTAQMVGPAGSGNNGGNVYSISVIIGSIIKIGPFAQNFTQPVVTAGDTIDGVTITGASISFGAGGGGLAFDDFGGANQILIDNSGLYGDASYLMRVDPDFAPFGVTGPTSLMPTYATIAADGTVGFATSFDVNSLWVTDSDVSSLFGGNLAANQIRGFSSGFFVEVVQVPAPGAMGLLAFAGLPARRRRR